MPPAHHSSPAEDEESIIDAFDQMLQNCSEMKGLKVDLVVPPAKQREQEVEEELERRREQQAAKSGKSRQREKSDALFDHFDVDRDGFLSYKELAALGKATGGDLPEIAYGAICGEVHADPKRGVSRDELFRLYTDAGMGNVARDYNLVFA
jgi:hypothetical protein